MHRNQARIVVPNQARSQSAMSFVSRSSDTAFQFIQGDLTKMKAHIAAIEQMSSKAVPLVPRNLATEIEELTARTTQLSETYGKFTFSGIKGKLDRVSDAVQALCSSVLKHIESDPNFSPSKVYADSFVDGVISRILAATRQKSVNLMFCLDQRLHAMTIRKEGSQKQVFLTELPRLETPAPRIVFKSAKPTEHANDAILRAIKDQTERLRRLYVTIMDLKERRNAGSTKVNFQMLSETARRDRMTLFELRMKAEVMRTSTELERKEAAREARDARKSGDEEEDDDVEMLAPAVLAEYGQTTDRLIEKANEELERARAEVKEEVSMLRARLDIAQQRLDQFGDFSGESHNVMEYIGMKVDDLVREQGQPERTRAQITRNLDMLDKYASTQYLIVEGSHQVMVDDLRRALRRARSSVPLLET